MRYGCDPSVWRYNEFRLSGFRAGFRACCTQTVRTKFQFSARICGKLRLLERISGYCKMVYWVWYVGGMERKTGEAHRGVWRGEHKAWILIVVSLQELCEIILQCYETEQISALIVSRLVCSAVLCFILIQNFFCFTDQVLQHLNKVLKMDVWVAGVVVGGLDGSL